METVKIFSQILTFMKTVKIFSRIIFANSKIYENGEYIFTNSKIYANGRIIFTNSKIYENNESIFMCFNGLNGLPYKMRQKIVIAKLLPSVTEVCYKVCQLLQSMTDCHLQSASGITKYVCDSYYTARRSSAM